MVGTGKLGTRVLALGLQDWVIVLSLSIDMAGSERRERHGRTRRHVRLYVQHEATPLL